MEVGQNLSAIKLEPTEIKSDCETEYELLIGITAQSISDGQKFEDTTEPVSDSGGIETNPTEIKTEQEDESVVEITAQDVVGEQNFEEESNNDSLYDLQSQGRPEEPEIEAGNVNYNQIVFTGLDDNERLVMNYTLGESQLESESVDLSTLNKSKKRTMFEKKDKPIVIKESSSKYQCPKCPYKTHTQAALKDHKRTHKLHKCNKCDYRTYRFSHFQAHSLTHLKPEESQYFYCYHCNFRSKWKDYLKVHIKRHFEREEVEFECHICDFKTKTRQIYSYHIEKHTPVAQLKTLNCPECDFTTKFLEDLNEHKYKYHGLRYQCPNCLYQTHTQATLNDHYKSIHKIHKYIECDYQIDRSFSLQAHSLTHLKPEESQYFYCYHCNFKFKYKKGLIAHIKRHFEREEVEFECHICDFKTKKRHIYSYHIGKHTPLVQCPECDPAEKSVLELQEHKYRCHGQRPQSYQCPICPYQTHTQATLKDHRKTHKIHKCIKCDYRTDRLDRLKNHSLIHLEPEEIQYFNCHHCNFKSKWRKNFTVHIRRHFKREDVGFECHICDFKTKKRLIYSHHIGQHSKKLKSYLF